MRICNEIAFFWNKFVLIYKFEIKLVGGNRLYIAPTFHAEKASQNTNGGVLKGKNGMATFKKSCSD